VVAYAGSEVFADDLTCVAVRIDGGEPAPAVAHAEIEVDSVLQELSTLRGFVRAFCRAQSSPIVGEDVIRPLELAITEAASNVIRHAYQARPDQRIRVVADADADSICVQILYGGEPFDPQRVVPPSFDGSREGGFGVYLIAQGVDSVSYSRNEQGENRICLQKTRKPVEGEEPVGTGR
jgi:serine/threonine-protein kinase RsbW